MPEIYIPGVINLKVSYNLWPQVDFISRYQDDIDEAREYIDCKVCESKFLYNLECTSLLKKGIEFFDIVSQKVI